MIYLNAAGFALGAVALAATQWHGPSGPVSVRAGQAAGVGENTTADGRTVSDASAPDHIVGTVAAVPDGPVDTDLGHKLS